MVQLASVYFLGAVGLLPPVSRKAPAFFQPPRGALLLHEPMRLTQQLIDDHLTPTPISSKNVFRLPGLRRSP